MDYPDNHFDVLLLLDVFEHLSYNEQYKALNEIKRILKDHGILILSIPNVANISSRLKFLILGELSRTDKDYNHLGERTFREKNTSTKRFLHKKSVSNNSNISNHMATYNSFSK